jgi:auxin responsive GH3 family protein
MASCPVSPKPSYADVIIAEFKQETSRARQVQERVLAEIVTKNKGTEYLSRYIHGNEADTGAAAGSKRRLVEEFRRHVPLVTHSELKPLFDRIASGDSSPILTADPVHTLSLRYVSSIDRSIA